MGSLFRQTYPIIMAIQLPYSHFFLSSHHPRDPPSQPTPASDLLAYPHKQQPLSQPPGVGISMSSAAVVVGSDQGL
jgi:hypothetical protein